MRDSGTYGTPLNRPVFTLYRSQKKKIERKGKKA